MTKQEEIIAEIRGVATKLGTQRLSAKDFSRNSTTHARAIAYMFGSWNRAVVAAGLEPITPKVQPHPSIPDDDLMAEIVRLTTELGKLPSEREMGALGKFSGRPYRKRWGTFAKARQAAYDKLGSPKLGEAGMGLPQQPTVLSPEAVVVPQTIKPKEPRQRKKVQFGEPLDFRGLRFAPINEQGVVYLFGMISRELGFLIESIRTDYPDCEGKRCVDQKDNRWEHVLIEFEYTSSHFQQHGHSAEDCDLIVCWIHDWDSCPLEVLELRSTIGHLPR